MSSASSDHGVQLDRVDLEPELAHHDARDVEDVGHDLRLRLGVAVDHLDRALALGLVELARPQEVRPAHDRVERACAARGKAWPGTRPWPGWPTSASRRAACSLSSSDCRSCSMRMRPRNWPTWLPTPRKDPQQLGVGLARTVRLKNSSTPRHSRPKVTGNAKRAAQPGLRRRRAGAGSSCPAAGRRSRPPPATSRRGRAGRRRAKARCACVAAANSPTGRAGSTQKLRAPQDVRFAVHQPERAAVTSPARGRSSPGCGGCRSAGP